MERISASDARNIKNLRKYIFASAITLEKQKYFEKNRNISALKNVSDPLNKCTNNDQLEQYANNDYLNLNQKFKWTHSYNNFLFYAMMLCADIFINIDYSVLVNTIDGTIPLLMIPFGLLLVIFPTIILNFSFGQIYQGTIGRIFYHISPMLSGFSFLMIMQTFLDLVQLLLSAIISIRALFRGNFFLPGDNLSYNMITCRLQSTVKDCNSIYYCNFTAQGTCRVNVIKYMYLNIGYVLHYNDKNLWLNWENFLIFISIIVMCFFIRTYKSNNYFTYFCSLGLLLTLISHLIILPLIVLSDDLKAVLMRKFNLFPISTTMNIKNWFRILTHFLARMSPFTCVHSYIGSKNNFNSSGILSFIYLLVLLAMYLMCSNTIMIMGLPSIFELIKTADHAGFSDLFLDSTYLTEDRWKPLDQIVTSLAVYPFLLHNIYSAHVWSLLFYSGKYIVYLANITIYSEAISCTILDIFYSTYSNTKLSNAIFIAILLIATIILLSLTYNAFEIISNETIYINTKSMWYKFVSIQSTFRRIISPIFYGILLIIFCTTNISNTRKRINEYGKILLIYIAGALWHYAYGDFDTNLYDDYLHYTVKYQINTSLIGTIIAWMLTFILVSIPVFRYVRNKIYKKEHEIISNNFEKYRLNYNFLIGKYDDQVYVRKAFFSTTLSSYYFFFLGLNTSSFFSMLIIDVSNSNKLVFVPGPEALWKRIYLESIVAGLTIYSIIFIIGILFKKLHNPKAITICIPSSNVNTALYQCMYNRNTFDNATLSNFMDICGLSNAFFQNVYIQIDLFPTVTNQDYIKNNNEVIKNVDKHEAVSIILPWNFETVLIFGSSNIKPAYKRTPIKIFEDYYNIDKLLYNSYKEHFNFVTNNQIKQK